MHRPAAACITSCSYILFFCEQRSASASCLLSGGRLRVLTYACLMPCPDITGSSCRCPLPGVTGEVTLCVVLQDCAAGTIALQTAISLCLSLQWCLCDIMHRPVCGLSQPCDYGALFEAAAGTAVGQLCVRLAASLSFSVALQWLLIQLRSCQRTDLFMCCAGVTDTWRACPSKVCSLLPAGNGQRQLPLQRQSGLA